MAQLRIDQVRALSNERLGEEEASIQQELLNLRFKVATRQVAGADELQRTRKSLARIKTVTRERKLAQETA